MNINAYLWSVLALLTIFLFNLSFSMLKNAFSLRFLFDKFDFIPQIYAQLQ